MPGGGQEQETRIPAASQEEQQARALGLSEAEARHKALLRELGLSEQGPRAALEGIRTARAARAAYVGPSNQTVEQSVDRLYALFGYNASPEEGGLSPATPGVASREGVASLIRANADPEQLYKALTGVIGFDNPRGDSRFHKMTQVVAETFLPPPLHIADIPGAEERLTDELQRLERNRAVEDVTYNQLLERLTSPTGLSDIENQRLEKIYQEAGKRGEEDLLSFADELAGSRGLRLSDTPIAAPLLRERQRGIQGLEAERARTGLDLQSRGLLMNQGLREFQEGLRQQAFQNRLALMGTAASPLQLAGVGLQERMASPTTTTSITQPFAQTFGQIAGGLGGLALGAGLGFGGVLGAGPSIAGFSGLAGYGQAARHSDKRLKRDIHTITNALTKLTKLTGVSFKWLDTDSTHLGVLAQEVETVLPELVTTDQLGRKLVDYGGLVGVLVQAVKELSQQVAAQEPIHG